MVVLLRVGQEKKKQKASTSLKHVSSAHSHIHFWVFLPPFLTHLPFSYCTCAEKLVRVLEESEVTSSSIVWGSCLFSSSGTGFRKTTLQTHNIQLKYKWTIQYLECHEVCVLNNYQPVSIQQDLTTSTDWVLVGVPLAPLRLQKQAQKTHMCFSHLYNLLKKYIYIQNISSYFSQAGSCHLTVLQVTIKMMGIQRPHNTRSHSYVWVNRHLFFSDSHKSAIRTVKTKTTDRCRSVLWESSRNR